MGLRGGLDGLLAPAGLLADALCSLPVPLLAGLLLLLAYFLLAKPAGGGPSGEEPQKRSGGAQPSSPTADDLLDPAASLCRSLGAPDHPHEEGSFVPSTGMLFNNATSPFPFQNEFCDGMFLSLHRATYNKSLDRSGDYPFGGYFLGKKRLWEIRLQLRFKTPPRAQDVLFGIELEKYVPMSGATKRTMETLVAMLKRVVGDQVYHSPGDNPETASGELERPVFAMPLWAFDQFIVTPEGQAAPALTDPALPSMGSKRAKRVRQFKEEADRLEFRVGPTYTFCFWGISQWLDRLNWEVKMPFVSPIDFNKFCGGPPVHAVLYTLKNEPGAEGERRHLQARKQYLFKLSFWSSKCRPDLERLQALLGAAAGGEGMPARAGDGGGSTAQRGRTAKARWRSWFACCVNR